MALNLNNNNLVPRNSPSQSLLIHMLAARERKFFFLSAATATAFHFKFDFNNRNGPEALEEGGDCDCEAGRSGYLRIFHISLWSAKTTAWPSPAERRRINNNAVAVSYSVKVQYLEWILLYYIIFGHPL